MNQSYSAPHMITQLLFPGYLSLQVESCKSRRKKSNDGKNFRQVRRDREVDTAFLVGNSRVQTGKGEEGKERKELGWATLAQGNPMKAGMGAVSGDAS